MWSKWVASVQKTHHQHETRQNSCRLAHEKSAGTTPSLHEVGRLAAALVCSCIEGFIAEVEMADRAYWVGYRFAIVGCSSAVLAG
jgi:hypothetical protein